MEESQIELLAKAMGDPESREIIKKFFKKNCSEKISKILIKIIDDPDAVNDLFLEYAQAIKEEYTDLALDDYLSDKITKKQLEEKIKNLEFDYFEMIERIQ